MIRSFTPTCPPPSSSPVHLLLLIRFGGRFLSSTSTCESLSWTSAYTGEREGCERYGEVSEGMWRGGKGKRKGFGGLEWEGWRVSSTPPPPHPRGWSAERPPRQTEPFCYLMVGLLMSAGCVSFFSSALASIPSLGLKPRAPCVAYWYPSTIINPTRSSVIPAPLSPYVTVTLSPLVASSRVCVALGLEDLPIVILEHISHRVHQDKPDWLKTAGKIKVQFHLTIGVIIID